MDLNSQEVIKRLADEHGADNLVVILGAPDDESAEIAAETVVLGDPTYAGALAETQLGLSVYHVLEEDVPQPWSTTTSGRSRSASWPTCSTPR